RSLKPEYRLDDNSSFISFYDLNIDPSDIKREYVTFWNPITNTNVYGLVKCPGCSLNGKRKCMSKIPFQNIVKIDIIGKNNRQKAA
ncbi:9830_t:CDS:2, partial [Funneliformis geosporum]